MNLWSERTCRYRGRIYVKKESQRRFHWSRRLKARAVSARLLRFLVRISLGACVFVPVSVICCQVEVSATSRSLVPRSHNEWLCH
jgi:hypothetical protein